MPSLPSPTRFSWLASWVSIPSHHTLDIRWFSRLLLERIPWLRVERVGFDVEEDVVDTDVPQADVIMKSAEPRLISRMVYQSLGSDIYNTFVKYQHPEFMASLSSLSYKVTREGLRSQMALSRVSYPNSAFL